MARTYGLEPPQFEQPQYHMFCRDTFEKEYFPLFQDPYRYGTTVWSPLASGLLTGKYNDSIPEGSRASDASFSWLQKTVETWHAEGKIDKVRLLTVFAEERFGCSVGQLALAWCMKNKNVSTVLLGATKPAQLVENLGALPVARSMTGEDMDRIDAILGNKPKGYQGFGGDRSYRQISQLEDAKK